MAYNGIEQHIPEITFENSTLIIYNCTMTPERIIKIISAVLSVFFFYTLYEIIEMTYPISFRRFEEMFFLMIMIILAIAGCISNCCFFSMYVADLQQRSRRKIGDWQANVIARHEAIPALYR